MVSKQKNLKTISNRIAGEPASRFRAAALAGTAGVGVAVFVYRTMQDRH